MDTTLYPVYAERARWWSSGRGEGVFDLELGGRHVAAAVRGGRLYLDGSEVGRVALVGAGGRPIHEVLNLPDFSAMSTATCTDLEAAVEFEVESGGQVHYAVGLGGVLVTETEFEVPERGRVRSREGSVPCGTTAVAADGRAELPPRADRARRRDGDGGHLPRL